jgi:cell division septation protein DedD
MNATRPTISLFGFLAGMVCGLSIAVAVALYLTNSPVPFVNKVQHSNETFTPDAGDPNRSMYSPLIPSAPTAADAGKVGAPTPEAPDTSASKAAPAPGNPAVPAGAAPTAQAPAAPAPAPAQAPPVSVAGNAAADSQGDEGPRLMLQVGAYQSPDDADAMRARLALLGLDAKVSSVQTEHGTMFRVRLGPYGRLDDLNGIRRTLSENGLEPQLVHVK